MPETLAHRRPRPRPPPCLFRSARPRARATARGRAGRDARVPRRDGRRRAWVLDDAFWHREPGTSVGDHLASGLVPVALAALLALAYPRLRAGARAAAALTAGALMIVAGVVDGVRHVAVDRLGRRRRHRRSSPASPARAARRARRGRAVALAPARRAAAAALPAASARRGRRGGRRALRRHAGRRSRSSPTTRRARR